MKTLFVLSSVVIGSGLLVANPHSSESHSAKSFKRSSSIAAPVGSISIVVDKSDYELTVYDDKGWYATYPVVFGNNSLGDKKMQGDRQTPEGEFHIVGKRVHDKWCRFMALDYPTRESHERFNRRKQRGEIPANAQIGGSIGIHGTWPREDFVIDHYKNWTEGCISMKNEDVRELYTYTRSGVKVTIKK